jgi:hypothetical protein
MTMRATQKKRISKAGDEEVRGVEGFEVRGLIRPAHDGEGPKGRGKPGIEHILVLVDFHILSVHFAGEFFRFLLVHGHDDLAVRAVPGGDAVAPPKLPGNAPVADVLQPLEINFCPALGDELDFARPHHGDGRLRQGLHADKPLGGEAAARSWVPQRWQWPTACR